jgi:hypothetical protein
MKPKIYQSRIIKVKKTQPNEPISISKKPKKDNSAFNINQTLHSGQSKDIFTDLQKKMEKIQFLHFHDYDLKLDANRLKEELIAAETYHPFVNKAIKMWKSIPLRSFDGIEGKQGNEGGGINNSPDPNRYKDTSVMEKCPYIKEILDSLKVPILKVRLMRLEPNNILPEHIDQFRDDRIFRMHIPIVTHPDVLFYVENNPKHIPEASLWYVNVRKSHKVHNKSKIIRVHLVFDVWVTDDFIINVIEPAINKM